MIVWTKELAAEYDALVLALASGALSIRHGDKQVTYGGFDDMRQRIAFLSRIKDAGTGKSRPQVGAVLFPAR
jgi:hypothetical protein